MWSRRRRASKQRTYAALRTALRQLFPTKTIRECTLITGIRFSLVETEWEDIMRDAVGITGAAAVAIQRQAVSGAVLAAYSVWSVRQGVICDAAQELTPAPDAAVPMPAETAPQPNEVSAIGHESDTDSTAELCDYEHQRLDNCSWIWALSHRGLGPQHRPSATSPLHRSHRRAPRGARPFADHKTHWGRAHVALRNAEAWGRSNGHAALTPSERVFGP